MSGVEGSIKNGQTGNGNDRNCAGLVPQLAHLGITEHDLSTCIKVLDAMSTLDPKRSKKRKVNGDSAKADNADESDGLTQFKQPNLRAFRKSLSLCLSLHEQLKYDGKSEAQYYADRLQERTLKRQKMAEKAMQKKYVASTDLRRGRVEKLEALKCDGKEEEEEKNLLLEYLVPDGHVDTDTNCTKLLENGDGGNGEPTEEKKLPNLRSCYTCKIRFRNLHHFYDQLCESCAPFNYDKRHQTADMSGRVAVVTGSRVKIGYQTVLKLLRAGCEVVATTRFPNNAVEQYRKESDFEEWKDRLHIYGLDLRDVTGLEALTRYLKLKYGKKGIDILINNACQTVRRPGGYYVPLVEREEQLWKDGDEAHKRILGGCLEFEKIRRRLVVEHHGNTRENDCGAKLLPSNNVDLLRLGHDAENSEQKGSGVILSSKISKLPSQSNDTPFESTGISHSAAMSQMAIVPEDVGIDENVMPSGLSDINGQQLDLRKTNSWLLKMDQVSTPEIMEW